MTSGKDKQCIDNIVKETEIGVVFRWLMQNSLWHVIRSWSNAHGKHKDEVMKDYYKRLNKLLSKANIKIKSGTIKKDIPQYIG